MSKKSVDPAGHISLAVGNIKKSRLFYAKLFGALGYKPIADRAWVNPAGFGIWIKQAEHQEPKYRFHAPGIHHLCFKAKSESHVDEVHEFLVSNGVKIVDSPAKYPEYTPDYYAVYFLDPDGIQLEIAYY